MQTAAEWRRLADSLVAQERYREAAAAYRKEAAIYRKLGDPNAAIIEEAKADRWSSEIKLFARLPGARPPAFGALEKHEPAYGCYLGAFIDRDERLGRGVMFNDQTHRSPDAFGQMVGKKHASAFCYLNWGRPFPAQWCEFLRRQNVAPHIAWEPNQGLGQVREDDYLINFARQAGRANVPIFLRYASEMNGDWTAYGDNPAEYIDRWKMVYRVMTRYAPNVAMLWCVACIPERRIPLFYPGDSYVDWVGINFYSVPFYDNDVNRPGLGDNPADKLKFVYREYAARKPIAICEYGASRLIRVDMKDRAVWAGNQINQLYASLPRLYPRVKLVDIFDNDNMKYAMAGRQLNNYSVTDTDTVRQEYSRAIAPDYFLSEVGSAARPTPVIPLPETSGATSAKTLNVSRGLIRISSWARCYSQDFSVVYALNGKRFAPLYDHGAREIELGLPAGNHQLAAAVLDNKGRVAARTETRIIAG
jgi:hypothetical protein